MRTIFKYHKLHIFFILYGAIHNLYIFYTTSQAIYVVTFGVSVTKIGKGLCAIYTRHEFIISFEMAFLCDYISNC